MNAIRYISLTPFVLWVFLSTSLCGNSLKPVLHRACLNTVTAEVSITLTPSKDTCNGFLKYRFFGRNNTTNSFEFLGEEDNINSQLWNEILPNKKDWQIKAVAYFSCMPNDSFESNSIWVDVTPPSYVEPDSVSVHFENQTLIAGWTNPPDADIMGYTLFEVDDNGNNLIIDEPNVLFYEFLTSRFDPAKSGNRLAIAGFDSCRNGGVISALHSPIFCTITPSSNYLCDKNITVSWTPYAGWVVGRYEVVVRDKNKENNLFHFEVDANTLDTTITLPYLDVNVDVFIRAFESGANVSTTSNRVQQHITDFKEPAQSTTLHFITVQNDDYIELEGYAQKDDSISLIRINPTGVSDLVFSGSSQGYSAFIDKIPDVKSDLYDYILIRYNVCGAAADTSNIAQNILLQVNGNGELLWNSHAYWMEKGYNQGFEIQQKGPTGWITIDYTEKTRYLPQSKGLQNFRVQALTTDPIVNGLDYSFSNSITFDYGFDSALLDTFFIPNVFVPNGNNDTFKIINPALSPGESTLKIYNRWGEKLFEGDALGGWDGKSNGSPMPDGQYIYIVNARYRGKLIEKKGLILLIK